MAQTKSLSEIKKIVDKYILKALELTKNELFEIASRKVSEYYYEPVFSPPDKTEPDVYKRTGTLMESLTASNISSTGNGYKFTVGFDDSYLSFSYKDATGLEVLHWYNAASHGGRVPGSHNYWDETLEEIEFRGGVNAIFKNNLIKVGLPIIK